MSISSASVYGAPQPTSWRDISGQISSLADLFRKERQRNEELFLNEAYRQITTVYNGDAFAWAQNEPESYKKFAKLLGLPETPGKVTPQGWLALGKIATAEALRQGKEPFEYSVKEEPIPTIQPQPTTPQGPTPPKPQGENTTLVSTPGGAKGTQGTPAPVLPPQSGLVTIDPKALYELGVRLGASKGAEISKVDRVVEPGVTTLPDVPSVVDAGELASGVISNLVDQYEQEGKALKLGKEHYEALLGGIRDALSKQGIPVKAELPKPQTDRAAYDRAVGESLNQAKNIAAQYPTEAGTYVDEDVLGEGFSYLLQNSGRTETAPQPPAGPTKIDQSAAVVAKRILSTLPPGKVYTREDVKKIVEGNKNELNTVYNLFNTAGLKPEEFQNQVASALENELFNQRRLDTRQISIVAGEKSPATSKDLGKDSWGPAAPAPNPTKSPQTHQPSTPTYTPNPKEQETKKLSNQISTVTTKVAEEGKVDPKELTQINKTIDNTIQPPPPEVQKQVKRVVVAKLKPEFQGNMYLRLIESQYQDPDSPVRKTFEGLYAGEVKSMEELKRLQLENRQLETTVKALYDDPEMVELLKQKIRAEVKELMASGDLKLAQARNLENVLTNEILKTAVSLYVSEMLGTMAQQQGNTELLKMTNELTNSLKIVSKDLGDKELTAQFATALSKLLARATGEQSFLQFSTKPGWLFGLWTSLISEPGQFPPQPPTPKQRSPLEAYRKGVEQSGIVSPNVLQGFGSQSGQNDAQRRILEQIMNTLKQPK